MHYRAGDDHITPGLSFFSLYEYCAGRHKRPAFLIFPQKTLQQTFAPPFPTILRLSQTTAALAKRQNVLSRRYWVRWPTQDAP